MMTPNLERLLRAVRRRARWADTAHALGQVALPSALLIAAATVVGSRFLGSPIELAWISAAVVPAVMAWTWLRPRPLRQVARQVDTHFGLDDRLGSALEFGAPCADEHPRTAAFKALVRDDAEALAASLDYRRVIPIRLPPPRRIDALAAAALAAAMLLPPRQVPATPARIAPTPTATLATERMGPGLDLARAEPLRQDLRELRGQDDPAARTADALLELLDKLESGEIDRRFAMAELERLESMLLEAEEQFEASLEEDPAMLAEAVRALAEALEEHEITREAARALERGDSDEVEQSLAEAGDDTADPSDAERQLERAMADAERRLREAAQKSRDTARKLAEEERRLKRQERRPAEDREEQERRLKHQRERVEQLRRKHEREMAAQRKLEELRRQAQKARNGKSGKQRREARQKLGRGAGQAARTARNQRRLGQARDGIEEAKTFVRRAGQKGESQDRRRQQARRFSRAARGKKGKKGKPSLLIEGDVGEGDPSPSMMMEGDGDQPGQGEGQDGDGQDPGPGETGGGESGSPGGEGMGQGSADGLGEGRERDVRHRNLRVDAKHGRGASRAEVISTSSQQGFASEPYRDVYDDYRSFAQSAMDNEEIPTAMRRLVKRYFKQIQPRD